MLFVTTIGWEESSVMNKLTADATLVTLSGVGIVSTVNLSDTLFCAL